MKKLFFILCLGGLMTSCEKNDLTEIDQNQIHLEEISKINSYENAESFMRAYNEFANTDPETLENISFYSIEKDNLEYSPALQAILNDDNQVIIDNKLILFKEGKFYEVDEKQKKSLKEVGSVSINKINSNLNLEEEKGTVAISNQWAFYKQRHELNCGAGPVEGRSPRRFKYVHEAYAEEVRLFLFYNYYLYLRVKLEYNSSGSRWRLSGERRNININLTNSSYLVSYAGQPITYFNGVYVANVKRNISFNSDCSTHQTIPLTTYEQLPGSLPNIGWDVTVSGTITEKMYGDFESNRWTDQVNW